MPPRALRAVDGPLGYDGVVFRRLTHLVSAWLFGLPAWALLRLLWRVDVRAGAALSSLRPPLLVVSNHLSLVDSHVFCLAYGLIPRGLFDSRIVPYHTPEASNFMRSAVSRFLHTWLRCVPIRRGAGVQQPGIDTVIELLRRGNVVYMFPEGTRSRDGRLGRATPGVGRVVLESGCSVLPVHLAGLDALLPVGARWPRLGPRLSISVGEVIDPERWAETPRDRKGWQQTAEDLLEAIQAL